MTGRKKGLSIGAAMKQRMDNQEEQVTPEAEAVMSLPASVPQPEAEDPLESFNTRLPRSLHRRLKVHTAQEGLKIQDVVGRALKAYLSQAGEGEKVS